MTYPCEGCVGCVPGFYSAAEREYCENLCNGTGQVADRRQSQHRKQGRRDGDSQPVDWSEMYDDVTFELDVAQARLQEAVKLLKCAERNTQWYAAVDAFLEKING